MSLKKMYNFTLGMNVSVRPEQLQKSDQFRLAYYHLWHKDQITIDYASSLFRNYMFGLVDASQPGIWTCGKDAVFGCGERKGSIGVFNSSTGVIEMEAIPGGNCPMEVKPFNMHTAGSTKRYLDEPASRVDKYAAERGLTPKV